MTAIKAGSEETCPFSRSKSSQVLDYADSLFKSSIGLLTAA
jgi:hypothetical protein